jgi:hypothetical protein
VSHQYQPAALQEDVARLRQAVEEGDPSIHRYRSPAGIDSIFQALVDSTRRPMDAVEFWRVVAAALAGLGDAHLTVLPNLPTFGAIYRDPGRALPLVFRVNDDRLFVRRNYLPEGGPPAASEILAIDGVPAAEYLDRCLRHISADGTMRIRGLRRLEREFELTCALVSGLPPEYHLTYRIPSRDAPGDSVRTSVVAAVPWRDRRALIAARAPDDTTRPAPGEVRLLPDEPIAILTLRTFVKGDGFDPGEFIARAFGRIRSGGVRDLVIDLRGNTGGHDSHAALLYQHIALDTFTYYQRRVLNRRQFQFLKGTDDWFMNYRLRFIPMRRAEDGLYELRMKMDRPMPPHRDAFTGPVTLLVDGNTFSAGPEFAALFRGESRGTIVGEETGTAQAGGSGATVGMVLPHTQLIVNIPLVSIHTALAKATTSSGGLLPDVLIVPSLDDLLRARDPVLDSALALARTRREREGAPRPAPR